MLLVTRDVHKSFSGEEGRGGRRLWPQAVMVTGEGAI